MDFENRSINRREFLGASAAAATMMAAVPVLGIAGKAYAQRSGKDLFVCGVCGHIEFGALPESCPVCRAPQEKFTQDNNVFSDAEAVSADLGVSHAPVVTVKQKSELLPELYVYEIQVRVGKKIHSMENDHRIRFIDCYVDDRYFARMLFTVNAHPAGVFFTRGKGSRIRVVEVCTVHGAWQSEVQVS
jgi:desulfoferrodoxin-like iron-binding protein